MYRTILVHLIAISIASIPTQTAAQSYSRTEQIAYHDNYSKWVLGQKASVTCIAAIPSAANCDGNDVITSSTYDAITASPTSYSSFGKTVQTLTYAPDGTVTSARDGNNNVITLANWKRGTPQTIGYMPTPEAPNGAVTSVSVDDNGWIEWVIDEVGGKTCYRYDKMGRVDRIRFPAEGAQSQICDDSFWGETTIEYRPMTAGEWRPPGVEAGQWRQYTATLNYQKVVYLDALWRPVLSHEYDASNTSGTLRAVSTTYDMAGRVAFQSYPSNDMVPAAKGVWTFFDSLGRVKEVRQDSEQGPLITRTEYLGLQRRVIHPNNEQTLTSYQAFDQPSYELPTKVEEPLGRTTLVPRDVFGKPVEIERKF